MKKKELSESKCREVFSTVQETFTSQQLKRLIEFEGIEQRNLQAEIDKDLTKSREEKLATKLNERAVEEKKRVICNLKKTLSILHRIRSFLNVEY